MQLHELQRNSKQSSKTRVGRGGKRGKTSGKGHKGQKARAGRGPRPVLRDIIKKIPKRRGHGINRARTVNDSVVKPQTLNVSELNQIQGLVITPEILLNQGFITKRGGKVPQVKILGNGNLEKAVTVSGCLVSGAAVEKIKAAGGSVETV